MRVPTRDNRRYIAPSLRDRRDLRRDERIPALGTSGARQTVYQYLAEAYRDVRVRDRFTDASEWGVSTHMIDDPGVSPRLSALLQEARWGRVLQSHRLAE